MQARRADEDLVRLLATIDDPDLRLAVAAERAVLEATGGTCRAPVGAWASVAGERFQMEVGGVNSDGSDARFASVEGDRADAITLARRAGEELAREVALR